MRLEAVPRCQHVKVNGTQCGSPALRNRRRCYFHEGARIEREKFVADQFAQHRFVLPLLEDANSVQLALMRVLQLLAREQMDHKTAGLMLYGLQTASCNLRLTNFEAEQSTDVVIDRDTVNATCIGGPQWFEDDFEFEDAVEEAEVEGETKREADGKEEEPVVAAQADVEAVPNDAPKVKNLSVEEARLKVQGVVRNWLLEAAGGKPGASPG